MANVAHRRQRCATAIADNRNTRPPTLWVCYTAQNRRPKTPLSSNSRRTRTLPSSLRLASSADRGNAYDRRGKSLAKTRATAAVVFRSETVRCVVCTVRRFRSAAAPTVSPPPRPAPSRLRCSSASCRRSSARFAHVRTHRPLDTTTTGGSPRRLPSRRAATMAVSCSGPKVLGISPDPMRPLRRGACARALTRGPRWTTVSRARGSGGDRRTGKAKNETRRGPACKRRCFDFETKT